MGLASERLRLLPSCVRTGPSGERSGVEGGNGGWTGKGSWGGGRTADADGDPDGDGERRGELLPGDVPEVLDGGVRPLRAGAGGTMVSP